MWMVISSILLTILKVLIQAALAWWLLDFPPFAFTFKQWFYIMAVLGSVIDVFSLHDND